MTTLVIAQKKCKSKEGDAYLFGLTVAVDILLALLGALGLLIGAISHLEITLFVLRSGALPLALGLLGGLRSFALLLSLFLLFDHPLMVCQDVFEMLQVMILTSNLVGLKQGFTLALLRCILALFWVERRQLRVSNPSTVVDESTVSLYSMEI